MIQINVDLVDDLVNAIIASEMRRLINEDCSVEYDMEEDRAYYARLAEAAFVVLAYYEVPGDE